MGKLGIHRFFSQVLLRASAKWLKSKCFGCSVADPAAALIVRKVTLRASAKCLKWKYAYYL